MIGLSFEEIKAQIEHIYGVKKEDNKHCLECVIEHMCTMCPFHDTCSVSGCEWLLCDYYEVDRNGIRCFG